MSQRMSMIPLYPRVGTDQPVSLPRDAIILKAQAPLLNGQTPLLVIIAPLEAFAQAYAVVSIRTFGMNETVPDGYHSIREPILALPDGGVWYVARREMNL